MGTTVTRSRWASGSAWRIISARSVHVNGFLGVRAWNAEPTTTTTRGAIASARASSARWAAWKGWKRPTRTARSEAVPMSGHLRRDGHLAPAAERARPHADDGRRLAALVL